MPPNISEPVATKRPSGECVEGVNAGRAAASAMIAMKLNPISRAMSDLKPYSSYDCGVFMLACLLHAAMDENLEMQL